MKILLTGGNGFVGSHLLDHIIETQPDAEVFCFKRSYTSSMERVAHIPLDKVTWINCDLLDANGVQTAFAKHGPFDKIFHLAAQAFIPSSYTSPTITSAINMGGTTNLLEAVRAKNKDAVVLVVSSSSVYGKQSDLVTEDTPFMPTSPYDATKCGQDLMAKVYHLVYGLKVIVTRAFFHTGPRRPENFFVSSFTRQVAMIEKGLQDPQIKVGNLESKRTIMNVKDCVRGYWLATEKCEYGEAYNIGGDETWRVGDVLDYIISLSTKKDEISVSVRKELLRKADNDVQIPDSSKFRKATGWAPQITIKETIESLLDYWRKRI